MSVADTFFEVCEKPSQTHNGFFLSLYRKEVWFGGTEEGGWNGETHRVQASQRFKTHEEAEAASKVVEDKAEALTEGSKRGFNEHCAAQCDWLEARGLDSDYLADPGGPDSFYVMIEERVGQYNRKDDPYYS